MASTPAAEARNLELTAKSAQPPALYILFFAEIWERFSYYGMRALLILFMTKKLLMNDETSYEVYGAYTALVYASTVIGGYMADRFLGNRLAIYIGGVLIAMGHFTLAMPIQKSLFMGLAFIILGTGFFKANISSLLGQFYQKNDPRRDGGFTIFYMGINIGGFLAPLICGLVGEKFGWHYGFALAGFGMLSGLLVLVCGSDVLKGKGEAPNRQKLMKARFMGLSQFHLILIGTVIMVPVCGFVIFNKTIMEYFLQIFGGAALIALFWLAFKAEPEERKSMLTLAVMLPFYMAFFACFEQAGASMNLFADRNVDRMLFGFEIPTTYFQMLNPMFIILCAPLISMLWIKLGQKKKDPLTPIKFVLGLLQVGLGFACLIAGVKSAHEGMTSMIWLTLAYFFHSTGELCLSPVGLSMATKLSPARFTGFMMGVLFLSIAFASYLAQVIAKVFGAPKGIDVAQDKIASLAGFADIYQFLVYMPIGAAVLLLLIYPFIKGVFLRHQ